MELPKEIQIGGQILKKKEKGMKKLVLLALSAMMMTGCDKSISSVDGYDIVIVDSCEYIRNYTASGKILVHKGNCKFCQQRLRKAIWEVSDSILNTMD